MPSHRLALEDAEHFDAFIPNFISLVHAIPDPRQDGKVQHTLSTLLFVSLSASMAGAKSVLAMGEFAQATWPWVRQSLGDSVGAIPPCHDTIGRLFQKLKPHILENLISDYAKFKTATLGDAHQITIDGKPLNATARRDLVNVPKDQGGEQPATTVSAYSVESGLTLACHTSTDPGSEHACVEQVLSFLDLRGAMVSVDAGNSYPKFAKLIRSPSDGSAPGDYLMCIKNNNARTCENCATIFSPHQGRSYSEATEVVEARQDKRIVRVATLNPGRRVAEGAANVDEDVQRLWPDAQCVIEVERYRGTRTNEKNAKGEKKQSWHYVYYVSSRNLTAEAAMRYVRSHWSVENKLHWIMDVHYGEDASRARTGYLAQNLATLRRVASNMLAAVTGSSSRIKHQMKFAVSEKWRDLVWGLHA